MTIDDIKYCLLTMIDCQVCEECNLYGITGTDHCEHDCVDGALHIINKYQRIEEVYKKYLNDVVTNIYADKKFVKALEEVLEDGNDT